MMVCRIFFTMILLTVYLGAHAESPWNEFDGDYAIGGREISDPPEDQPSNTHVRFRIYGEAAQQMYNAITSDPVIDRCGPDHLTKVSKNIKCDYFEDGEKYACYFGIGFRENEVVKGVSC
jgi:hypothetical protein